MPTHPTDAGRPNEGPAGSAEAPPSRQRQKRAGRPKKAASAGRVAQVHVLLTEGEKARVRDLAAAGGLSVSEFGRRRMLGRPVTSRVDEAAERQLRRIGVNLNQIARAANTFGHVERRAVLDGLVAELRGVMARLRGETPPHSDP